MHSAKHVAYGYSEFLGLVSQPCRLRRAMLVGPKYRHTLGRIYATCLWTKIAHPIIQSKADYTMGFGVAMSMIWEPEGRQRPTIESGVRLTGTSCATAEKPHQDSPNPRQLIDAVDALFVDAQRVSFLVMLVGCQRFTSNVIRRATLPTECRGIILDDRGLKEGPALG